MWETFFEATAYAANINQSHSSSGSHTSREEEIVNPWNLGIQIAAGIRPLMCDISTFSKPEQTFLEVMMRCWDQDPQQRPEFCELSDIFTGQIISTL
jgi:hypothetical protein